MAEKKLSGDFETFVQFQKWSMAEDPWLFQSAQQWQLEVNFVK